MDKRKKLKRQVSTDGGFTWQDMIPYEYIAGELIQRDSPDCNKIEWRTVSGYICEENTTEMTQWVADTGYVCVGYDKYNKEKEQVSYNSGISWADTGNTRAGSTLIEQNSTDCGYVPPSPYPTEYLTTEALGSGNISLRKGGEYSNNWEPLSSIQYSKNNGTWFLYTYGTAISVVTGDKIRWKGTIKGNSYTAYSYFAATADYKAYGNPLSLLNNDSFVNEPGAIYEYAYYNLFDGSSTLMDASGLALPATTLENYCYGHMFYGCSSLTTAPVLPATTLSERCYYAMFSGCTSLTTAPELPATTLAEYCYYSMFNSCTSLTTAPSELPATTLASLCYWQMFYGCTSLTTAPVLPATTLAGHCYDEMFSGCTSLTTAPVLPATTLSYNCYESMFQDCTSLTTAPSELPATTLAISCYSNMFKGCTSLTTAPEILPATTLKSDCYHGMFSGCTSLTGAPALPATRLYDDCYYYMFYGCTSLTTAPVLPATTMADSCYESMFSGCTSLTTAPSELPATTLAISCYSNMFKGCTSLTTAPELPATTLAYGCYQYMFKGCTSLTGAPALPATTLAELCYYRMFYDCTSLNSVTCCATDISASNCTTDWLSGTSSTGTFHKDANATWQTGASGIPSGWTTDTCGCGPITRWVADTGYMCVGFDKKNKEKEQISYDSGNTWTDTGNTRAGSTLVEQNSTDCGYVPPSPYPTEYLTTEALGNGIISLQKHADSLSREPIKSIQYSKNNGDWTSYTYGTQISVVTGDKIRWKGTIKDGNNNYSNSNYYSNFYSTADYRIYGNPLSLLRNDNFISSPDSLYDYAYYNLFADESTLKDASGLALPATTLREGCYYQMFKNCTSLTGAPALSATTLASHCYYGMFQGCTSLTTAPELHATTLVYCCYYYMFKDCTSLNSVTCCALDISATQCTWYWLNNVAATGTFVKNAAMSSWGTGISGIPTGWTVQDA